jgi:hypothetical protein
LIASRRGRGLLVAACVLVPLVLVAIAGRVFASEQPAGSTGVRISDFAVPAGCSLDAEARQRIQQEIDQSDGIAAGDAAQVAAVREHVQIYVQTWIRDYCARNGNPAPAPPPAQPGNGAAGATGVRISDFALPAGCSLDAEARQRIQQEIDQSDGIAAGDAAQVAAVREHVQIYVQTWIRDYCARH